MDISSLRPPVMETIKSTGGDFWCLSLCRCFRTAGDEALDVKAPRDPSPPSPPNPPSPRQSEQSPPDAVQAGSWIWWATGSRCLIDFKRRIMLWLLWDVLLVGFFFPVFLFNHVGEVPTQRPPVARVAPQREPPKLTVPQALALQSGG